MLHDKRKTASSIEEGKMCKRRDWMDEVNERPGDAIMQICRATLSHRVLFHVGSEQSRLRDTKIEVAAESSMCRSGTWCGNEDDVFVCLHRVSDWLHAFL